MDLRTEFYTSINKPTRKEENPKKKSSWENPLSFEEQILLASKGESALIKEELTFDNSQQVEMMLKLSEKEKNKNNAIEKEIDEINQLRAEARKKYLKDFAQLEKIHLLSSSSTAAGGGSGGRRIDPSMNSYVVDGYIDDYVV
jgi:hypothetical protein